MIIDFYISCVRYIANAWDDYAQSLENWAETIGMDI